MTYRGVVKDYHYATDENDSSCGGFDSPEKAFEWAKKTAKETGFSHVNYWVEDEDIDPTLPGYSGIT